MVQNERYAPVKLLGKRRIAALTVSFADTEKLLQGSSLSTLTNVLSAISSLAQLSTRFKKKKKEAASAPANFKDI